MTPALARAGPWRCWRWARNPSKSRWKLPAAVSDGLPIRHRVARRQPEEGAEAVAVSDLERGRIIRETVQGPEPFGPEPFRQAQGPEPAEGLMAEGHEPLEHEQRRKARAPARRLGLRGEDGGVQFRLELLPRHDLFHAQKRRLERGHIEVLQELVEQAGVAKRDEIRHAPPCPPLSQNTIPSCLFYAERWVSGCAL